MSEIKITIYRGKKLLGGKDVLTGEIGIKYMIPKDYLKGKTLVQENKDFVTLSGGEMDYLRRVIESLDEIGKSQSEILKKKSSPINSLEVIVK